MRRCNWAVCTSSDGTIDRNTNLRVDIWVMWSYGKYQDLSSGARFVPCCGIFPIWFLKAHLSYVLNVSNRSDAFEYTKLFEQNAREVVLDLCMHQCGTVFVYVPVKMLVNFMTPWIYVPMVYGSRYQ
jgi:hypothetical protein